MKKHPRHLSSWFPQNTLGQILNYKYIHLTNPVWPSGFGGLGIKLSKHVFVEHALCRQKKRQGFSLWWQRWWWPWYGDHDMIWWPWYGSIMRRSLQQDKYNWIVQKKYVNVNFKCQMHRLIHCRTNWPFGLIQMVQITIATTEKMKLDEFAEIQFWNQKQMWS